MNVTFDRETYKDLIYEANLRGISSPCAGSTDHPGIHQKNQTGPYEGANQPEDLKWEKNKKIITLNHITTFF